MARTIRRTRKRRTRCPVCGDPAVEPHDPFCSRHCKDVDLARWLGGEYRIPSDEVPDVEELAKALERDREPS